jgi:hypothetical protein
MKTLRRRFLKLGMLLGGTALLWSCVAPILTVPPPNEIAFSTIVVTDSTGAQQTEWITTGGPLQQAANADYFVFNRTQGQGVIAAARNDGSFTAPPMQGNPNDQVLIYYKTPFGDYSDSICVLLVAGTSVGLCE